MPRLQDVIADNRRLRAELQQRAGEVAIVNSIQHALAAGLSLQGIYDAVGDTIRDIFREVGSLDIRVLDPRTGLVQFPYVVEQGERIVVEPMPSTALCTTLGDGFQVTSLGEEMFKGKSEPVRVFAVDG